MHKGNAIKGEYMRYHKVPDETVKRLPLYLRYLQSIARDGRNNVKSSEFADSLGINPPQVRKDLSFFGGFGTPGVGYNVKKLLHQLRNILKLKKTNKTALVGAGDLGSVFFDYSGFSQLGFEIVAAFDKDPIKIGTVKNGVTVEDISKLKTLKRRGVRLAIVAVPAGAAQETVDRLVEAGVVGILNLAPSYISVPKKIRVISIDIALDLARLPYYLPLASGK